MQGAHSITFKEWVAQCPERRVWRVDGIHVCTPDLQAHSLAYAFGSEVDVRAKFGMSEGATIVDVTDRAPFFDMQAEKRTSQQVFSLRTTKDGETAIRTPSKRKRTYPNDGAYDHGNELQNISCDALDTLSSTAVKSSATTIIKPRKIKRHKEFQPFTWTADADANLMRMVTDKPKFLPIARTLGLNSAQQCRQRFNYLKSVSVPGGFQWTKERDDILLDASKSVENMATEFGLPLVTAAYVCNQRRQKLLTR
jgi:hypothetical protein